MTVLTDLPLAALDTSSKMDAKSFDDVAADDSSFADIMEQAAKYRLGRTHATAAQLDPCHLLDVVEDAISG